MISERNLLISVLLLVPIVASSCSGQANSGGGGDAATGATAGVGVGGSTGGATGVAGTTSSGGATGGAAASLGGTTGLGGATNVAGTTGGVSAGGVATGGTKAVGGTSAGGTSATGGTQATGGAPAGGGTKNSGGTSASGGNPAGGSTASAGNTAIGGSAGSFATGGKSATGGSNTGGASSTGGSSAGHWVGTWTASPYYDSANQPPASLSNSVLRQVAHVSLGSSQIRVQFSNLFGNGPVTINSAHIAICRATPAVDSTIDTTTDKALAFSGTASVTIAQGNEIWSDPIDFTIAPLGNISITTAFRSVPSNVCGHSGSRTTSYLQTGSTNVSAASMTSATQTAHWYYISGIDVMADASATGIVAIGDSLTDGRGSDTDENDRWTDDLAARLQGNAATADVAMMNQGIGATDLVGPASTTAQSRFARDVLGQSGVRYAIVFDGVNDILADTSFASIKTVYDSMISQSHANGLLIYGATITPFGAYTGYTAARESVRQQVNTYIKSGVFDGYLDFDAAITDGGNPPEIQSIYGTWAQSDGLHPNPAGYQKMADSVGLTLFTK